MGIGFGIALFAVIALEYACYALGVPDLGMALMNVALCACGFWYGASVARKR